MTQVFAAINHGLSEEYGKLELPHQEAKTRYVAKIGGASRDTFLTVGCLNFFRLQKCP
jgi:hypothetical protein